MPITFVSTHARGPEIEPQVAGAAIEHVAIVFPGEADTTVHLNHLGAGELERIAGTDPGSSGGERQLARLVGECPGTKIAIRTGQLDGDVDKNLADLYTDVYRRIAGSHLGLYNAEFAGRLTDVTIAEFFEL